MQHFQIWSLLIVTQEHELAHKYTGIQETEC